MAYNPWIKHGDYHERSQEELTIAEEEFKRNGGLPKILREQPTPINNMVRPKDPKNIYRAYEMIGVSEAFEE